MQHLILILFRILTVLFFAGLVGCALMIVVSWCSIFYTEFTNKD